MSPGVRLLQHQRRLPGVQMSDPPLFKVFRPYLGETAADSTTIGTGTNLTFRRPGYITVAFNGDPWGAGIFHECLRPLTPAAEEMHKTARARRQRWLDRHWGRLLGNA